MRRPAQVWGFIADRLAVGEDVMLLTVVAAGPGSPGRTGFAAAVAADGTVAGTIGGGPMEQRLVGECIHALRGAAAPAPLRILQHRANAGAGAEASGLVCGGWQQVAAHRLTPADLALARQIRQAVAERRPLPLTLGSDRICAGEVDGPGFRLDVIPDPLALVVGGGQVGRAVAHVLGTLDFDVVLADPAPQHDGPGFRTEALPMPNVGSLVADPAATYAVVVAPTVEQDALALAALLPLRVRYLGLLGTVRKRRAVVAMLPAEGRAALREQHLHSPVGLPIGSSTPEEIAVSIAAEMIMRRHH